MRLLGEECSFWTAGGEGQRAPFPQRVLRPLAATYLEGQQRTKFCLSRVAVGVMTSNLAVPWFLVERFLEAFRRLCRLSSGIN